MPNTTTYEYGDVVLVPFPLSESAATTKKRPAVVLNTEAVIIGENEHLDLIIVIGITSVEGALGGVAIKKWKEAGLKFPSYIKPIITTVAQQNIVHRLGKLTIADINQLKLMLARLLNLTASSPTSPQPPSGRSRPVPPR